MLPTDAFRIIWRPMEGFWSKLKRKLHYLFWNRLKPGKWSRWLYPAEWRLRFFPAGEKAPGRDIPRYLTAIPNPGAGIGHQMSNWIAGLHYAGVFGLTYAPMPFSDPKWDRLLGLSEGRVPLRELIRQGYKQVRLPRFSENEEELSHIRSLLEAYPGRRVVFRLERDQFFRDLYLEADALQKSFWSSPARAEDPPVRSDRGLLCAVHIRRGDIGKASPAPGMEKRWMSGEYYLKLLQELSALELPIEYEIYSQGSEADFPELKGLGSMTFMPEASEEETFLAFARSDILISAKSSFSYKPALLNRGLKICPRNFWHGYPEAPDFILAEDDGSLKEEEKQKLKEFKRSFEAGIYQKTK